MFYLATFNATINDNLYNCNSVSPAFSFKHNLFLVCYNNQGFFNVFFLLHIPIILDGSREFKYREYFIPYIKIFYIVILNIYYFLFKQL